MAAKTTKTRHRKAGVKKFTTKVRVYWSDCDSAGVVYFGNFFRFFEVAEEELFHALGWRRIDIYNKLQIGFPRAEVWCRYRKPVTQGDLLEITTWISKRTNRSLRFHFEARQDGQPELLAEANYWIVCVSLPHFRPVSLPQPLLDLLRDYLPPLTSRSSQSNERAGRRRQRLP